MKARLGIVFAVVGLLAVSPVRETVATSATGLVQADLQAAWQFRSESGLPADLDWIEEVASGEHEDRYGVPLTAAEAAELDRRGAIALALDRLDFLQERPWFAGIWMDQKASGEVVISVSTAPDESVEALLELLPSSASLRFAFVDYPKSELDTFRAQLEPFLVAKDAFDAGFRSLWVDPVTGRVRLSLEDGSTGAIAQLGSLAESPLLGISYEHFDGLTACTRSACAYPIKGGIDLDNHLAHCTAGFRGRPVAGTPTSKYLITAGHCFEGAQWFHDNQWLGSDHVEYYQDGSFADAGIIKIRPETVLGTSPANLVFYDSTTVFQPITGSFTEASMSVGAPMCRAGAVTGYLCTNVARTNQSRTIAPGITLFHQWVMKGQVAIGDSGGPVGVGAKAGGIISYGFSSSGLFYTGYSTIAQIIVRGGGRASTPFAATERQGSWCSVTSRPDSGLWRSSWPSSPPRSVDVPISKPSHRAPRLSPSRFPPLG